MTISATDDGTIIFRFGGGVRSAGSPAEIGEREASAGVNFDYGVDGNQLRPRNRLQLAATAPNGQEIRGWAQLEKFDGTISSLIQAGDTVYVWDGTASGFTSVGTVTPSARLRGPAQANSVKDDLVIITDIAKQEVVKTWDGTTFANLTHNLGGSFFAAYVVISFERAFYLNVITNNTDTPHLLVASKQDDFDNLTVTNKPSSALAADDPFYLPLPNLRPGNGLTSAFGRLFIASLEGDSYELTGTSAKDHALQQTFFTSVTGTEAFVLSGNDIVYGRQGAVELLSDTQRSGDYEADDLSNPIRDELTDVRSWTMAYSRRQQRVYCLPAAKEVLFVYDKRRPLELSPWYRWTTASNVNFSSQTLWTMKRPTDELETAYLGDQDGNIYEFDNDIGQDAGAVDVTTKFDTATFSLPPGRYTQLNGWVRSRKAFATTLTLRILWGGDRVFDDTITVSLDNADQSAVYGGAVYYGGTFYYGLSFAGRLQRTLFSSVGYSSEGQVEIEVTGGGEFWIEEIGLTFEGDT